MLTEYVKSAPQPAVLQRGLKEYWSVIPLAVGFATAYLTRHSGMPRDVLFGFGAAVASALPLMAWSEWRARPRNRREKRDKEQYGQVRRLKSVLENHSADRWVEHATLDCLESAARAAHSLGDTLHALPDSLEEIRVRAENLLHETMGDAIYVARPLIRNEEQGRSAFAGVTNDAKLVSDVCARIQANEQTLRNLEGELKDAQATPSLREHLLKVVEERRLAEAELDGIEQTHS